MKSRRWASPGRRADMRGETLVEILLTTLIMSVVVVSLLALMTSLAVLSGTHAQTVVSGNLATVVAERIEQDSYVACVDPANQMNTPAITGSLGPAGYVASITRVRYLQSNTSPSAAWVDRASCVANPLGDQGVQEVTIEVKATTGREGTARLIAYKRNSPLCSTLTGWLAAPEPGERC